MGNAHAWGGAEGKGGAPLAGRAPSPSPFAALLFLVRPLVVPTDFSSSSHSEVQPLPRLDPLSLARLAGRL